MKQNHLPTYFRREEAAQYITETFGFSCSKAWLAKLASIGGGPVFRKAGRVPLYTKKDLDIWAKARLSGAMRASNVPFKNSSERV